MKRFALLLSWDGSNFAGWQSQPNKRTVSQVILDACTRIGEKNVQCFGSSRTDSGVHAEGQIAHLDLHDHWEPLHFLRSLNYQLPQDCSCTAIATVPLDWDACTETLEKTYKYRIDNRVIADPFSAAFSWRPSSQLCLETLQEIADLLPGTRNWKAFARRGEQREDMVRTVTAVHWQEQQSELICTISGTGFIYRMVRSLVGSMVSVNTGTCIRKDLERSLTGTVSPASCQQAPAHGLSLHHIHLRKPLEWETLT